MELKGAFPPALSLERELSKQSQILNPSSLIQIEECRSALRLRVQTYACHACAPFSSEFPSLREGLGVGSFFLPQGGGQEGAQFPSLREGIGVGSPLLFPSTVLVDFDNYNGHENGILLF